MVLDTSSVRLRRISVLAIHSRRHGACANSSTKSPRPTCQCPRRILTVAEHFPFVNARQIGRRRSSRPSRDQLQGILLHLYHSRFVGSHAVAGGFFEFLAAHPGSRTREVWCCKFHSGQVSDTLSFCCLLSTLQLRCRPIFSQAPEVLVEARGHIMGEVASECGHLI